MSTPDFVPQNSSSLTAVRYYTQYDPYFYTVDNRPLQDLASNITTISQGGGDSGRRGVLLTELALSSVFQELFATSNANGLMSGLAVTYPGSNTIQINPGSLYQVLTVSATNSTAIIKQALLLAPQSFSIVQPSVAGQSINYVIEAQYQDLSSTNMATSPLPYLDSTNAFLPCVLMNGQLALQLKTGTAAATGSQTSPAVDAGWVPLYTITSTYGVSNPTIFATSSSPTIKGLNMQVSPIALPTGGTTTTTVAQVSTPTFQKSSTEGVVLPISFRNVTSSDKAMPNPYLPIKFKLVFSSDTANGVCAFQLQYLALSSGGSTTSSYVTTSIESISMPSSANTISTYQTATCVVPSTAFSGLVSNAWALNTQKLFVILQRVPGNAADTNTGNFFLHDIIAYQ
jgi:hypothetical protein